MFGENRVQEAYAKWPQLKEKYSGLELHLVGPLQSNKAEDAVAFFDAIDVLDRTKLARAIAEAVNYARLGRMVLSTRLRGGILWPGDSRNRQPLTEVVGTPIQNVVIASCTGGSLADLLE